MNDPAPDLLIIGGGVIGLGLADLAVRRGLSVTLLERERVGSRASWAGAGMLNCRPWPRVQTPDYHDLLLASIECYAQWASRLLEETDIEIGLRKCGALELFSEKEHTPEAERNIERLLEGCAARGVPAERLSPEAARRLEPNLEVAGLAGVIHFPDDGQVRSPRLLKALALSCRQRGARLKEGVDVADIWVEKGRVRGAVARDGTRYAAERVAVCAGAWSGRLEALVRAVPRIGKIEPVRGQILCYQTASPLATRLLTMGHNYLLPRPDGVLLAGSTMERVGFEATTTPEGQAKLRAFAERRLPALRQIEARQGWAGLRPGLKGPHPILGAVPGMAGLYVSAGHFRNGLALAPVSAEILIALILGEAPPVPADPWRPQAPSK